MQVLVHTDHTITGDERTTEYVTGVVERTLGRFADRLTRVEVFLADENSSHKAGGADKTCRMEARPAHHQPVTVTHHSGEVAEAIDGAATKLEHLLDHLFGKRDSKKGRTSMAGEQGF